MAHYYLAEEMKNRRTSAGRLVILMPLTAVCLAAALGKDYFLINSYNWWYIILFPGMTAFICAAVGGRDQKMGNQAIWTLPADMGAVWDGKVIYGIRCMGIALLVLLGAALIIGNGIERIWHLTFRINLSAGGQILALLILFITSVWQVPFCLFLQQATGTFPMIIIHVGSYLLTGVTISLKPFFSLWPGGIPARMMCILMRILPNGLVAEPGSMTFTPELLEQRWLLMGIAAAVLWFLIFWTAGRRWFVKSVGK